MEVCQRLLADTGTVWPHGTTMHPRRPQRRLPTTHPPRTRRAVRGPGRELFCEPELGRAQQPPALRLLPLGSEWQSRAAIRWESDGQGEVPDSKPFGL